MRPYAFIVILMIVPLGLPVSSANDPVCELTYDPCATDPIYVDNGLGVSATCTGTLNFAHTQVGANGYHRTDVLWGMISHMGVLSGIYTKTVAEYSYSCDATVSGTIFGTGGVNRVVRLKHEATGSEYVPSQQTAPTWDLDQETEDACGYSGLPGDDWCQISYSRTRHSVITGSGVADPDADLVSLRQYPNTIQVCMTESTVAINEFAGSLRIVDVLDQRAYASADGCVDVNVAYQTLLNV